jgi:hypothetical protein
MTSAKGIVLAAKYLLFEVRIQDAAYSLRGDPLSSQTVKTRSPFVGSSSWLAKSKANLVDTEQSVHSGSAYRRMSAKTERKSTSCPSTVITKVALSLIRSKSNKDFVVSFVFCLLFQRVSSCIRVYVQ